MANSELREVIRNMKICKNCNIGTLRFVENVGNYIVVECYECGLIKAVLKTEVWGYFKYKKIATN